jgi:hypothetical protein
VSMTTDEGSSSRISLEPMKVKGLDLVRLGSFSEMLNPCQ